MKNIFHLSFYKYSNSFDNFVPVKHLKIMKYIFIFSFLILISCGSSNENKNEDQKIESKLWQGDWQMVGYDNISVENRDTIIVMSLNADETFGYKIFTRNGDMLSDNLAKYEINDQHSVITVFENEKKAIEYFIRKVDQDSLIFQSDTLSIKWKRLE